MMSAHVAVLAVLVACYVTGHVSGQGCEGIGEPWIDWLNNNITCPPRAVCADVFSYLPESTCKLIRSNCLCNGQTVCPWNSPDHRLYETKTLEQYTCRPVCTVLPYCPYVRFGRDRSTNHTTAMVKEHRSDRFNGRNYRRMSCRCPRNHVRPTRHRMSAYGVQSERKPWETTRRNSQTTYYCEHTDAEGEMPDPCDE